MPRTARAIDFRGDLEDHVVESQRSIPRVLLHVTGGRPAMSVRARASATIVLASRSRTTALVLCVPLSMPMKRDMEKGEGSG